MEFYPVHRECWRPPEAFKPPYTRQDLIRALGSLLKTAPDNVHLFNSNPSNDIEINWRPDFPRQSQTSSYRPVSEALGVKHQWRSSSPVSLPQIYVYHRCLFKRPNLFRAANSRLKTKPATENRLKVNFFILFFQECQKMRKSKETCWKCLRLINLD